MELGVSHPFLNDSFILYFNFAIEIKNLIQSLSYINWAVNIYGLNCNGGEHTWIEQTCSDQ